MPIFLRVGAWYRATNKALPSDIEITGIIDDPNAEYPTSDEISDGGATPTLDAVLAVVPATLTEGQVRTVGVYGVDTELILDAADTVGNAEHAQIIIEPTRVRIKGNNADGQHVLYIDSTDSIFVDDRLVPIGIQYDADYSATLTDRSLVDKGTVAAMIADAIAAIP